MAYFGQLIGRLARPVEGGVAGLALLGALALALLPLPLAAALLGTLIVVTCSFLDPLWGLYALVLSVPVQELAELPGGQTVTQLCALLALVGLVLRTLLRRQRRMPRELLLPWLFFLLSLLLAAAFASYSQGEATKMLGRWPP
jgi:nitrate reductase gamma subunit